CSVVQHDATGACVGIEDIVGRSDGRVFQRRYSDDGTLRTGFADSEHVEIGKQVELGIRDIDVAARARAAHLDSASAANAENPDPAARALRGDDGVAGLIDIDIVDGFECNGTGVGAAGIVDSDAISNHDATTVPGIRISPIITCTDQNDSVGI